MKIKIFNIKKLGLRAWVRARGFTLVETLATMIVILIISGVLFSMLIIGKTTWQASVTRASNRQDLQVAMQKIELELMNSRADTITNNTAGTPKAFSFLSAYDANGNFVTDMQGAPVWQKYVIYYIPTGTTALRRIEVYGNFTGPMTTSQLIAYCNGTGKLISSKITSISLTPDLSGNSASLSITVQNKNQQGKGDSQSQTATIFMRN